MLLFELLKDMIRPITQFESSKEFYKWKINYRKRLFKYKDYHKGEDCFIIGNGPSIGKMDLMNLNNFHLISLNKSHLLKEQFGLSFSYHVCVDDEILDQMLPIIESNSIGCSSFISQRDLRKPLKDLPHINRLFTTELWSFYTDITMPISVGYTVTFVALQLAYFMGFKRIFLLGIDHSWKTAYSPNSLIFFEGDDDNHFHPEYSKGGMWHSPDKEGNEASYSLAKHFYKNNGREIIDATVDGKLFIFPKMKFNEVLEIAKPKIRSALL
jgi:hypothetical protein